MIVRRIPFTSANCSIALIRILMNGGERRRMRPTGAAISWGFSLWWWLLDGTDVRHVV